MCCPVSDPGFSQGNRDCTGTERKTPALATVTLLTGMGQNITLSLPPKHHIGPHKLNDYP